MSNIIFKTKKISVKKTSIAQARIARMGDLKIPHPKPHWKKKCCQEKK
jgi:hypothetical protein